MTQVQTDSRALWSSMPGWGIVADLMPPEILQARRALVVRRMVTRSLIALVCVMVLLFAYAFMQKRSASNALTDSQDRTITLQSEVRKYSDVTTMQGTVNQVQNQVSSLLKTDIDFPKVLADLQKALPPGVTLGQMSMTVVSAGAQTGSGAGTVPGGGNLDPGAHAHIGTVTLAGSAAKATDVSAYVDKLRALTGVVEPYPVSNVNSGSSFTYNIQLTLTDELYTHRFDVKQPGAK